MASQDTNNSNINFWKKKSIFHDDKDYSHFLNEIIWLFFFFFFFNYFFFFLKKN